MCSDVIRPNVLTISTRVSRGTPGVEETRCSIFHASAFVAMDFSRLRHHICASAFFESSLTFPRSPIMYGHDFDGLYRLPRLTRPIPYLTLL